MLKIRSAVRTLPLALVVALASFSPAGTEGREAAPQRGDLSLSPLLRPGQAVTWWFAFKFNTSTFSACGADADRACPFGGTPQPYKKFGQRYAYASSANTSLQMGAGCIGAAGDPLAATFAQVYNGDAFYVIWNDQFYNDPMPTQPSPWGHSKGMVAWNKDGQGFALQVSTPSWPAAGSSRSPRKTDGNTLGCVKDDDVEVSQHFFSLRLTKSDLATVLKGLRNASVVTDPKNPQIVRNGGPADIQALVNQLGTESTSTTHTVDTLSTGVRLISKPSKLHVPPWQMVSAVLGHVPLRVASWWAKPQIPSSTASTKVGCWDSALGKPAAVQIATTGTWQGKSIGLTGGLGPGFNHAKIGVSTSPRARYAIFGDLNQQGTISGPNCGSSQDGRGGLFYVVDDSGLAASVAALVKGRTAPAR